MLPSDEERKAWRSSVERLCASRSLGQAERLRMLLRYLAERALAGDSTPVKEYQLGVEVLGRPPEYDPRVDPIVRVEMRQLRLRIASFYASEGRHDALAIDIPRGSYRVVFLSRSAAGPSSAEPVPEAPAPAPPRRKGRVLEAVWLSLAVAAASGTLALPMFMPLGSPATVTAAPVPAPSSIAVLPFANLSGASDQAYFANGLTDEIRDALMRVSGLRVTGRSSSLPAASPDADVVEVGRRIGVGAVLSGSVRREAARVRVIAQLTDVTTGLIVWSEAFDRDARQSVEVQTTIATAVAGALRVRLNPGSGQLFARRSNDDPRAHDLVLRARALAATRTTDALAASVSLFEQAIARDPGYALAFAGLADANGTLAFNGAVAPADAVSRARAAAAEALRLDPSLGEALAHLASLDAFVDWNWTQADALFERAISLTPSHARARAWHGQSLAARGRFAEAVAALVVAQQLDPLASSVTYALGETYLYAGRFDDALLQARRLLAEDPGSWGGHNLLARALFDAHRWTEARAALVFSRGELWADITDLVASDQAARARGELSRRASTIEATDPYTLAALAALSGDRTHAMRWLRAALELRQVGLASLAVDPSFRSLKGDAEFEAIVRRIGLR